MSRFIIRRVLWGVVLLIVVTGLLFLMFRYLPTADPAKLRAGRLQSPKIIAAIRRDLGLDKSTFAQFWLYMKNVFGHFNLGYSYYSNAPVKELILDRLPATLSLVFGGAIVWLVTGVAVGIVSAIRARTRLDRASMGTALVLVSAPEYWLGLVALYLFSEDIGKVPIFPGAGSYVGLTTDPVKWFESLILPWLVVAAGTAAIYARLVRGNMIETMSEDYIRTARAKGLPERKVIVKHGLRAALTPIVTIFGMDLGLLLGGAIITEVTFSLHGLGLFTVQAINNQDLPEILGVTMLAAFFIVIANLVVDIFYAVLDPRVRF